MKLKWIKKKLLFDLCCGVWVFKFHYVLCILRRQLGLLLHVSIVRFKLNVEIFISLFYWQHPSRYWCIFAQSYVYRLCHDGEWWTDLSCVLCMSLWPIQQHNIISVEIIKFGKLFICNVWNEYIMRKPCTSFVCLQMFFSETAWTSH